MYPAYQLFLQCYLPFSFVSAFTSLSAALPNLCVECGKTCSTVTTVPVLVPTLSNEEQTRDESQQCEYQTKCASTGRDGLSLISAACEASLLTTEILQHEMESNMIRAESSLHSATELYNAKPCLKKVRLPLLSSSFLGFQGHQPSQALGSICFRY